MGWGTQIDDVEPYLPPEAAVRRRSKIRATSSTSSSPPGWPSSCSTSSANRRRPAPDGDQWAAARPAPASRSRSRTAGAPPAPVRQLLPRPRPAEPCTISRGGDGRSLLILHGLGERAPAEVPSYLDAWHGPIAALDFTGHGLSTIHVAAATPPRCCWRMQRRPSARGREGDRPRSRAGRVRRVCSSPAPPPDLVCGAILTDGAGILGGGNGPGSPLTSAVDGGALAPPDPFALVELAHDLRPPDYATSFVRLATQASPLDHRSRWRP